MKTNQLFQLLLSTVTVSVLNLNSVKAIATTNFLLENSDSPQFSETLTTQSLNKSIYGNLSSYVQNNQPYFSQRALDIADTLFTAGAFSSPFSWEGASVDFDPSNGNLIIDLNGIGNMTGNSLKIGLTLTPDNCLSYSLQPDPYIAYSGSLLTPETIRGKILEAKSNIEEEVYKNVEYALSQIGGNMAC